ncbi:MAG TPA: hypothetical protein VM076_26040 [Gemmatimonadaceae bacterium]|nr:hypothetical protein [Gemmatimonadaceae bacterium]
MRLSASLRRAFAASAVLVAACSADDAVGPTVRRPGGAFDVIGVRDTIVLHVGDTLSLSSNLPVNYWHPITWTISDDAVAGVLYWHGFLTAKKLGSALVTASSGGREEQFPIRIAEEGKTSDGTDTTTTTTTTNEGTGTGNGNGNGTGNGTGTGNEDGGGSTTPATPNSDLATQLVGTTLSVADVRAMGGAFARFEQNFVAMDDQQWAAYGAFWVNINYYDRAMIYYAWYRRTGDGKYLRRANEVVLNYRQNYVEAANYIIQPHWAMLDGLAMHYLTTGDEADRTAIGKVADMFTALTYRDNIGTRTQTDNRVQAHYLETLLLARQLKAPSVGIRSGGILGGHDWDAELRRALPLILSTQDSDGAFRLSGCGDGGARTVHPFTTGLLMDALARYYDTFERDPRIVTAVKKAADYLWANDWMPSARAFRYIERVCPSEGFPTPAADLNNLIVNGYAWIYKQTGDAGYRQRADEIFEGAVYEGWIGGAKQFNQVYAHALRYLESRR